MNRQVVKELPERATPVRPTKEKPTITKKEIKDIKDEQGHIRPTLVDVTLPWSLDSDTARLIGEAKSLPKGYYLKLTEAHYIFQNSAQVAWFCLNKRINLLHFEDCYYLQREAN